MEAKEEAMSQPFPIGVWVRMLLPPAPGEAEGLAFIGFTYVDQQAGPSAKGGPEGEDVELPSVTVRLPFPGVAVQPLAADEAGRRGLPLVPSWLVHFGPQPAGGTTWGAWRQHPALQGRFHPDYPDDLQVLVHEGGPRLTDRRPELIWVRVTGVEDDRFSGQLLNQPHQLPGLSQGDTIRFIVPQSGEHPLRVTERYLRERADWIVGPCSKCGLSELFDPPSVLLRVVFPDLPEDAEMEAFTSFCGACGGVQAVRRVGCPDDVPSPGPPQGQKKKWWKLWRS